MMPETPVWSLSPRVRPEHDSLLPSVEMRMILIAGADEPSTHQVAMPLFRAGHVPVVGEWFTDPLLTLSGLEPAGDETFDQLVRPLAERLLARCDAILRVGGPSDRADTVVRLGRARGLRVFFTLEEALEG
jgi:hypothetical protein